MLPAHNPNTQETEAGGLWIQDQYRLHGKALSQKIIVVLESYFRVSNKDLILNIEKGMPQKICIWNIVQFSLFLLYLRMFSLYESYFILEFSSVYLPHPQVTLIFLPSDYKMQLPTSVHSVSIVSFPKCHNSLNQVHTPPVPCVLFEPIANWLPYLVTE